ncbi:sigma-70 family RNA polymerase sigma factor [Clostridiaceae bacterium]|nr:sigma-70 family RNA polymerase sigma factor [Clostridiaceae bacterium]
MISGEQIEVSKEIYQAYYGIERHTRTLDEKDQRHGLVLYSNLDTPEMLGEAMIPDRDAVSTEDAAIARILREKLHCCLNLMPEGDQKLLNAIYFDDLSERELAEKSGVPQSTVNDRRRRAIQRLKKFF